MLTQLQHFELSQRKLFAGNQAFMDILTCEANPMTKEDLEACIKRRPAAWERFSGFLRTLPTRAEVAAPGFNLRAHYLNKSLNKSE